MMDFHTHTNNSLDSNRTMDELIKCAMDKGLTGIAVTDHAETWYFEQHQVIKHITDCINQVKDAKKKYTLKIFQGIEIGSPLDDIKKTKEMMSLCDYDVILNSVHCVKYGDIEASFAAIDFSLLDDDTTYSLMDVYFDKMLQTAKNSDFDILCHLTYPFRYTNGRYGKNIDVMKYENIIDNIFETLIKRQKSLEINTASIGERYGKFNCLCPDEYFIKKYYNMGGRHITLGSDSHRNVDGLTPGNGFDVALPVLKKIGFDKITYFEKRKMFFEKI